MDKPQPFLPLKVPEPILPDPTMSAARVKLFTDENFAWGWWCNLVVPMMQNGAGRRNAEDSARVIMMNLFGYDMYDQPMIHEDRIHRVLNQCEVMLVGLEYHVEFELIAMIGQFRTEDKLELVNSPYFRGAEQMLNNIALKNGNLIDAQMIVKLRSVIHSYQDWYEASLEKERRDARS